MKTLLLTAVVLGAALAARAEDGAKREFPTAGIEALSVTAGSGPIEVRAGEKLEVSVVDDEKPGLCRITMETVKGTLVLKAENAKAWFVPGPGCEAGFRVSAPAALPLTAKAGSGDIRVEGRAGKTELADGSGKISGTLSGRLDAKAGSGGVELSGLASGADVKSGSGDVTLTWSKAPARDVDVKCGSGSVVLVFPAGTKVRAIQLTGSGTAMNMLGEDPDAKLKVSVTAGSGDSTIKAAD